MYVITVGELFIKTLYNEEGLIGLTVELGEAKIFNNKIDAENTFVVKQGLGIVKKLKMTLE